MSKIITLRKGLDINLRGKAQESLADAPQASEYALSPLDFEGVTPKLLVKVGDEVKATRLETVVDHLQRHGVTASYAHLPQSEEGVSADLVCHALRKEADLVVTGAYGRGPLAERVLGGVTRDLLKTADLHWFMAS